MGLRRTSVLQAVSGTLTYLVLMFLFIKPTVLFASDVMRSIWELHNRPLDMSTSKYLAQETTSRT